MNSINESMFDLIKIVRGQIFLICSPPQIQTELLRRYGNVFDIHLVLDESLQKNQRLIYEKISAKDSIKSVLQNTFPYNKIY